MKNITSLIRHVIFLLIVGRLIILEDNNFYLIPEIIYAAAICIEKIIKSMANDDI